MKKKTKTLFSYQIEANNKAHDLSIALNMVGLNYSIQMAELIIETLLTMGKMGRNFDIKSASSIIVKVDKKYSDINDKFNNQKLNK